MIKEGIDYQDALKVIKRLLEVSEERDEPFEEPVVMVGGTAMAAHGFRKESYNVDLYAREFSFEVVHQVEQEFKAEYFEHFRIDVTSVENIWGYIMLRDIQDSEPDRRIRVGERSITIRKLSPEDLFLLKLDTEREKDREDLPILYEKTNLNRLAKRFNTLWKWHGDPKSVLGFADSFISTLLKLGDHDPAKVIKLLELPEYMTQLLYETWEPKSNEDSR